MRDAHQYMPSFSWKSTPALGLSLIWPSEDHIFGALHDRVQAPDLRLCGLAVGKVRGLDECLEHHINVGAVFLHGSALVVEREQILNGNALFLKAGLANISLLEVWQ